MGATTRRNLYYNSDQEYNPNLTVDINEYLIDTWPQLSLKQRTSVWTIAQDDEEFDYESLYEQIDDIIYELAETDKTIELPPEDEESDEDDEDDEPVIYVNVLDYLNDGWPDLTEDQKTAIKDKIMNDDDFDFEVIYELFDEYVVEYAKTVDNSIDVSCLDDDDDEDEEDEGEAA